MYCMLYVARDTSRAYGSSSCDVRCISRVQDMCYAWCACVRRINRSRDRTGGVPGGMDSHTLRPRSLPLIPSFLFTQGVAKNGGAEDWATVIAVRPLAAHVLLYLSRSEWEWWEWQGRWEWWEWWEWWKWRGGFGMGYGVWGMGCRALANHPARPRAHRICAKHESRKF